MEPSKDATPAPPREDDVIGIAEICARLDRNRKSVYWLVKHGYLKAWKAHDRWETTKADLQAYIDKHRKGRSQS